MLANTIDHDSCGTGFVCARQAEHRVLKLGLEALCNMAHRGGIDADGETGDGAGVLIGLPRAFFATEVKRLTGLSVPENDIAVGFFFLPQRPEERHQVYVIAEGALRRFGISIFGWRWVPYNASVLSVKARDSMPVLKQVLLGRDASWSEDEYERRLYLARRVIDAKLVAAGMRRVYMPSMSSRSIVYKGLLRPDQVQQFYGDLRNKQFVTQFCVFHVRFGTNTFPEWKLAHPYRGVAHNGEINTIAGNRNWMRAREKEWTSAIWGDQVELFRPLLFDDESDSASLDRVLELLILSGRDPIHALSMLMPEAWENKKNLSSEVKGSFEFLAAQQEPWDGPACLVFAANNMVGAKLDRNGLRPARYKIYRDGLIVFASEFGVVDLPEAEVVTKGRLKPGQMIAIDLARGQFYDHVACRQHVAQLQPYADWVEQNMLTLNAVAPDEVGIDLPVDPLAVTRQQISFGWSRDTLDEIIPPMVQTAKEAVSSMGNGIPNAVLSLLPKALAWYFKQRFAQVTNPPIDSLRELIVMSLIMYLGRRGSWLEESPAHAKLIKIMSPFLTASDLAALETLTDPAFKSQRISCLFARSSGAAGYDRALTDLCAQAEAAVRAGVAILILTDRNQDADQVAIPMLQVVGTVHHHLIARGLRLQADIVVETGTVADIHTFAITLGYGASAVYPYLACQTISQAASQGEYGETVTPDQALVAYQHAIEAGLYKVMAKMGVSTLRSYCGAQLFTAVGLGRELIKRSFAGTISQLDGVGLEQVATDTLLRHEAAFLADSVVLPEGGDLHDRPAHKGGEVHAIDRAAIKAMYQFRRNPSFETFAAWARAVQEKRGPISLRDLWRLADDQTPVPLVEVESVESVLRRFMISDMSDGALSPEAHRTLAEAMNRMGSRSGSGEGGEDPTRFGTIYNSAMKQWAPGRFGATPTYILNAIEMVIKMAQGAKPGEGGQLPAFKVTVRVADQRFITPFKHAYSPAPHHDIYSIEDIMQVIYDLKQLHPGVRVCVKLVAIAGIGAIAAGIAKAGADVILIAGGEGGTGAGPASSKLHAGEDWETGLAEAHQTLVAKGWRDRVILRVDGGLRTARDVIVAALLGAEEFGFGTLPLLAVGCVMKRECQANTCPVGVATQDEELRKKFTGKPEDVIALFTQLAESVRQLLAQLGLRRFEELVGHTELLYPRALDELPEPARSKAATLDLSRLVVPVGRVQRDIHPADFRRPVPSNPFDDAVAQEYAEVLQGEGRGVIERQVTNRDRNIGTRLSGIIARRFGNQGLPITDALTLKLTGSGGQSLGMFLVSGILSMLEGDANDGVGKSLSSGEIVIRPPTSVTYTWVDNIILGNVALYGATGGRLFAAGQVGERFAVRNSGAIAVVEGMGDHGCSFMTRGVVMSIGDALGWNFGSGMTGGWACLYDQHNRALGQLHSDVVASRLTETTDIALVHGLIEDHFRLTASPRARDILANWDHNLTLFWLVKPR